MRKRMERVVLSRFTWSVEPTTAISTQNEVKDNEKVVDENKEDEIEVDPLEMFMKGIDETVKKEEVENLYRYV